MKPTASLLFLFFIEVSHAFGMLSANALSLTVAGSFLHKPTSFSCLLCVPPLLLCLWTFNERQQKLMRVLFC